MLSVNKDIYGYLQKLMGGSSTAICYDGAGLSILQKTIGYGLFGSGNNPGCERDSKVVFLVGANAHLALLNSWHFLQEARAAGAKLVHIIHFARSLRSNAISLFQLLQVQMRRCSWQ